MYSTHINKQWVNYSTSKWSFFFVSLTELTRFSTLSFVLWSFQVLGERFDGLWNKEWQEPNLGDAHGTPKIRTPKIQSLGMPRKASPLSSTSIGNFTWSYIFIYHMICVLLGASCIIWFFAYYFTTIILAVHTFWESHIWFGIC